MKKDVSRRSVPLMGTIVTIEVVAHEADPEQTIHREETIERAFKWFQRVEECCTRFDARSELMQLTGRIGAPVAASEILFEAVRFALEVAEESGGAFDPTVGHSMETRGFNREYSTRKIVHTAVEPGGAVSYRDILLDPDRKTITLLRPLILDLGAVAKGMAIDLAARELHTVEDFSIDAGGDLYLGGSNSNGKPWRIGIRHPRQDNELIDSIRVSNRAVCTSGDYERRLSGAGSQHDIDDHHILDPRSGASANTAASVTVVAPNAMLADALATAAFVLGPDEGIRFLDRLGVDGLIFSPTLDRYATQGMSSEYKLGSSAVL